MTTIRRRISSVVAGFVAASVVMTAVEYFNGHVLYPGLAKAAEGVRDREVIRQLFATAPKGALLVVIAGWALGGFTGGWVAGRLAPATAMRQGRILAVLLSAAAVANNLMLPPPLWFWIAGLALIGPATLAGARTAAKPQA